MNLRLYIPTKMIDLTAKQLRFVSWLFLQNNTEQEFLIQAFLCLSGLKLVIDKDPELDGSRWYQHPKHKAPFIIDSAMLPDMYEKCRFLLTPDEVKPIKWIRSAKARHYRLYNASFDEYLMAENFYFAYINTKKEEHLNNLIAVLYRKPWQSWSNSKIQKRAKYFDKVSPIIKNSVFMWYVGFRSYIPKRCPELFNGEKSSRPFNPREYVNGMIHQLTNGDLTIKNDLLKAPVMDALDELEQRAIEVSNMKQE